jgi:hypothetical protein
MITINFSSETPIILPVGQFSTEFDSVKVYLDDYQEFYSEEFRGAIVTGYLNNRDISFGYSKIGGFRQDAQLNLINIGNPGNKPFEVTMLTTNIAEINENNYITNISKNSINQATVRVNRGTYQKISSVTLGHERNRYFIDIESYLPGTLGKHIQDFTNLSDVNLTYPIMLFGSNAQNSLKIYSKEGNNPIRNTTLFTRDLDLTGLGYKAFDSTRPFTAITPLHIIMAAHHSFSAPAPLTFVTNDNQLVTRTLIDTKIVISNKQISYEGGRATDLRIGKLDSALPETIKTYKTFPPNFGYYLLLGQKNPLFGIGTNSNWRNRVFPIKLQNRTDITWGATQEEDMTYNLNYMDRDLYNLSNNNSRPAHIGTSGSPRFVVVNGELIQIGGNSMSNWSFYIDDINNTIDNLGTINDYYLKTVDLFSFNYYGD